MIFPPNKKDTQNLLAPLAIQKWGFNYYLVASLGFRRLSAKGFVANYSSTVFSLSNRKYYK